VAPSPGNGTGLTVLYSGNHGLVHGMDVILDAAERLREDRRFSFVFVGDGPYKERLVADARDRRLENVRFLPSQPPEELAVTMRAADVCVATTDTSEFSRGTIPVKIFDYMACARPVVAALDGDGREVVDGSGGGLVVAPGDGAALADALARLADSPDERRLLGERGCAFVAERCSRRALAERLVETLVSVVAAERELGASCLAFRRYLGVKYTLDFLGAVAGLIASAPLFALVAILVRLDSPGRAVFTQQRIGVLSHEFTIYKFRTMRQDTPDLATDIIAPMQTDYTTRIGRILRRTGIDELPNLLNVLRGDMSLVGPRPALYNQYELIDLRRQTLGDQVRPGLTGWAQINGRDSVTLEEKVRLDAFYVRNCSFLLDVRILLRTAAVLSDTQ
jgi:O-antigen biosynthesis protein WbqP